MILHFVFSRDLSLNLPDLNTYKKIAVINFIFNPRAFFSIPFITRNYNLNSNNLGINSHSQTKK